MIVWDRHNAFPDVKKIVAKGEFPCNCPFLFLFNILKVLLHGKENMLYTGVMCEQSAKAVMLKTRRLI